MFASDIYTLAKLINMNKKIKAILGFGLIVLLLVVTFHLNRDKLEYTTYKRMRNDSYLSLVICPYGGDYKMVNKTHIKARNCNVSYSEYGEVFR